MGALSAGHFAAVGPALAAWCTQQTGDAWRWCASTGVLISITKLHRQHHLTGHLEATVSRPCMCAGGQHYSVLHHYTYYITHHPSYNVPLLALHACHDGAYVGVCERISSLATDGSLLSAQDVLQDLAPAKQEVLAAAGTSVLAVQEHPTLHNRPPCLVLHPCGTQDVMALLQQSPMQPLEYMQAWWRWTAVARRL